MLMEWGSGEALHTSSASYQGLISDVQKLTRKWVVCMEVRKITLCFCSEDILPIEQASNRSLMLMGGKRLRAVDLLRSTEEL